MNEAKNSFEVHIKIESPDSSAVDILHKACNLSKKAIKLAMSNGSVWLTRNNKSQRIRRATRTICPGDELHLYYNYTIQEEKPSRAALIKDLGGYSVWHKPRGMRSQGSKWGDHCTIGRWSEKNLKPERISFIVHRLDLNASGLILIAHSKSYAASLAKLFSERKIEKRYKAIIEGDFSVWASKMRIEEPIDGKNATSEISFIELSADSKQSLVDVSIETGRKHQIRKHLAHLGHPIIGDRLYGSRKRNDIDMQLTAYLLAFQCPITNTYIKYLAPEALLPRFS